MLLQALGEVSGENAGAGGQGIGAIQRAIVSGHLELPPKDARPKAGQKRHGFGGLNKQWRVERARGNAGVEHQDWSLAWLGISNPRVVRK
jgi:hypothetical protein